MDDPDAGPSDAAAGDKDDAADDDDDAPADCGVSRCCCSSSCVVMRPSRLASTKRRSNACTAAGLCVSSLASHSMGKLRGTIPWEGGGPN